MKDAGITPFSYQDVVKRARELAALPYAPPPSQAPEALAKLGFDQWRDIRYRPDKALPVGQGGVYRMQMFHLGFLFQQAVTVNVVRDGVATPVPYSPQMFDFGANRFARPLPVNVGFAGFRLHYPLNDPRVHDELISFIGASYFRFLGRDQVYGLSARGIAINAGGQEEFPAFREFWVEAPKNDDSRVVVCALLDGPSIAGAYQFIIYPAKNTVVDVEATLFPRRTIAKLGVAPLTSMFFIGENDRRLIDDYRPEAHDSDGLLIHCASGEWIWRPLRNPPQTHISAFVENNVRGFGLMQRDRVFEHYEDLDIAYERRPGYWVEPRGDWGEGVVELIELPTTDETNDNIVACWIPKAPAQPGEQLVYRYAITSIGPTAGMHAGGEAVNSFQSAPRALGSAEPVNPNARRLMVDFAGGELKYWLKDPSRVQVDASVSDGRILRTFLIPNPHIGGFRAGVDVEAPPGKTVDVRVFLRAGAKALTETWICPWKAP
ncbi:glucan biosynthesis protein [Camelimonas abortus]